MVSVFRKRLFSQIALLIVLALLTACERPFPRSDDSQETATSTSPAVETAVIPTADPNVGGGQPGDTEVVPTLEPTATSETPRVEPTEEATPVPAESTTTDTGDTTTTPTESEPATETAAEPETTTETAAETTGESTAASAPEQQQAQTPATHTVAAGENLYRIGLRYGISWRRIAEANNLTNPNRLIVGQVLRIPSSTEPIPQPTPSPLTETTYIVRRGDNLFRIGLAYGVSWVQIAEANGLVNPNQIYAGQVLKIPVNRPGPAPQFTHRVRTGETLFLISLQYGVSWPAIAEANNLSSPYVIYPGQTLVIPGG